MRNLNQSQRVQVMDLWKSQGQQQKACCFSKASRLGLHQPSWLRTVNAKLLVPGNTCNGGREGKHVHGSNIIIIINPATTTTTTNGSGSARPVGVLEQ